MVQAQAGVDDHGVVQLLMFLMGAKPWSIRLENVRMILPMTRIAVVPGTPPHVLGVISHRGEIIPVVDLKELLGLQNGKSSGVTEERIMVVCVEGIPTGVGCIVDGLLDIRSVPASSLRPPPSTLDANVTQYLEGEIPMDKGLVGVLQFRGLAPQKSDKQ